MKIMLKQIYRKSWFSTVILGIVLVILSFLSLFVGVIDVTAAELFSGDAESIELFLI